MFAGPSSGFAVEVAERSLIWHVHEQFVIGSCNHKDDAGVGTCMCNNCSFDYSFKRLKWQRALSNHGLVELSYSRLPLCSFCCQAFGGMCCSGEWHKLIALSMMPSAEGTWWLLFGNSLHSEAASLICLSALSPSEKQCCGVLYER